MDLYQERIYSSSDPFSPPSRHRGERGRMARMRVGHRGQEEREVVEGSRITRSYIWRHSWASCFQVGCCLWSTPWHICGMSDRHFYFSRRASSLVWILKANSTSICGIRRVHILKYVFTEWWARRIPVYPGCPLAQLLVPPPPTPLLLTPESGAQSDR